MNGPRRFGLGFKIWLGLAAGAALSLVAVAYLDPHFIVAMANQVWACF
jgi:hypothetical protein